MKYDIVIIGAGASGLMAASFFSSYKTCLVDSNSSIGAKIKISGGGKCNITNKFLSEQNFSGNHEFIKNVFKQFNQLNLLDFLAKKHLYPKLDEKIVKGTYFCNSSSEVIQMFEKLTKKTHKKLNTKVLDVEYLNNEYHIITRNGTLRAEKLIIASGGLSYPKLNASDIGLKIAQKFGHNIVTTTPALVGFTVQKSEFWFKELSGLSIDARVTVNDKSFEGKLLFTHKGCSGPVILSSSLYWTKGTITIDFSPHKKSYLPKRFRQAVKNIDGFDLHNYTMAPAGNFGYSKAEVMRGGVDTLQIDENFQSKMQKNLYFIGEVLDVTGELGGYNFQWAFSSGYCCGKSISKKYKKL